jgi:CBS domain-containing protein
VSPSEMFRKRWVARELMSPVDFFLREGDDAWAAASQLFGTGRSGAPVLDAEGRLVGVISPSDLAQHLRENTRAATDFYEEPDRDPLPARPAGTVGSLMSRVIVQVPEDMPADEIERHMLRRRVHRVLVTREGRALGVVTTADLLRAR